MGQVDYPSLTTEEAGVLVFVVAAGDRQTPCESFEVVISEGDNPIGGDCDRRMELVKEALSFGLSQGNQFHSRID